MRTHKFRIFSALLAALMLMLTLTACGNNNKPDYEKLKTDIIGIWCDIDGPEYFPNEKNPDYDYYQVYEFTSSGRIAYHTVTRVISQYTDYGYEIRDDILDVEGSLCRIAIDENDILTMTSNSGVIKLRRMSMEEVCNFSIVYIDDDNYNKQLEYTDYFKKNWPAVNIANDSDDSEEYENIPDADMMTEPAAQTEASEQGSEASELGSEEVAS